MNKDRITAVIVTLNKVEVHGKDNLSMLLGCIQELEKMMNEEAMDDA
ncbi:MAG: hypothetical protein ACI4WX_13805 [Aristaeellaceae bacterium]